MHWLMLGVVLLVAARGAVAALPAGIADANEVSVSGLSSGGFMAVQLHVAHSATFRKGVGVIAGGPYFCAEGSLANALGRCMARRSAIPVARLVATTRAWSGAGLVDPVANLAASRVYLFTGGNDSVVATRVADDLQQYYRALVPAARIALRREPNAEHGMVTDDFGAACATHAAPYIVDCDFDLAGALLAHLYGALAPRRDGALTGRLIEFDQREFGAGHGLGKTGWAFVPAGCSADAKCRLHVALHGCRQNDAEVGDTFVQRAGYNRWADANRIVVLYPQTGSGAVNGCWDWWGYAGADYARKSGRQVGALKAMVDRLLGIASGRCFTASNVAHVWARRATLWWGAVVARGSNESLGWWWKSTTLKEDPPGHFALGSC